MGLVARIRCCRFVIVICCFWDGGGDGVYGPGAEDCVGGEGIAVA